MALRAAEGLLSCPHCGGGLALGDADARCPTGHRFDIARQGYLNLLGGPQPRNADTAAMLAARGRVLTSGLFDRLSGQLARHTPRAVRLLEVGAGTAYHLRTALGDDPERRGIALDVSVAAAKVAARADPRIASVVADVWAGLPLPDRSVDAVLCVFAPRNLPEFARVLAAGGRLLVVTPNPGHLEVLRARHGLLGIEETKQERLLAAATEFFDLVITSRARTGVELSVGLARDLVGMGPNAFHGHAEPDEPLYDHLDTTLRVFEPIPHQRV